MQADEYEYKIAITGQNTISTGTGTGTLSAGAGTGSQCVSTTNNQPRTVQGVTYNNPTDNPNVICTLWSNDRDALRFTLTATPRSDSPPPSLNNEVRVALKFSGTSDSLNWGGPLRLSGYIAKDTYMIRMKTDKPLTHSVRLVNQKKGGKPPKGTLTIRIIEYCYTKGFVERCSKPGSPSSLSARIN